MLKAASQKHGGAIDMDRIMKEDENEEYEAGDTAAIFGESLFHNRTSGDEDYLDQLEKCTEFGDDSPKGEREELDQRVKDTTTDGLPISGQATLDKLLQAYENIFRLRLGKSKLARLPPMKIEIDAKTTGQGKNKTLPIISKSISLGRYIGRLVEIGFLSLSPQATWQPVPHLVTRGSPTTLFGITVDSRQVNAATKPKTWPMPNLKSEPADFAGNLHFPALDVFGAYWEITLRPSSYNPCKIINTQ